MVDLSLGVILSLKLAEQARVKHGDSTVTPPGLAEGILSAAKELEHRHPSDDIQRPTLDQLPVRRGVLGDVLKQAMLTTLSLNHSMLTIGQLRDTLIAMCAKSMDPSLLRRLHSDVSDDADIALPPGWAKSVTHTLVKHGSATVARRPPSS
ncbi:MAG: hypothetical protein J2O49_00325, partial [Sciscionella sp.]|nr:hypothetical protein [Sciscionella sp.]